jgi:hypothetical protein
MMEENLNMVGVTRHRACGKRLTTNLSGSSMTTLKRPTMRMKSSNCLRLKKLGREWRRGPEHRRLKVSRALNTF